MGTTKKSLSGLPMSRKVEALSRLAKLAERMDKNAKCEFDHNEMKLSLVASSRETQLFDGSKFFDLPSVSVKMEVVVDTVSLSITVNGVSATTVDTKNEFLLNASNAMAIKLISETEQAFQELDLMPYTRTKDGK